MYKRFTLTHLSLRNVIVVAWRVLKAFLVHSGVYGCDVGGLCGWSIARILGKTASARARTLSCIFLLRARNCRFVSSVGAGLLIGILSGGVTDGEFWVEQCEVVSG